MLCLGRDSGGGPQQGKGGISASSFFVCKMNFRREDLQDAPVQDTAQPLSGIFVESSPEKKAAGWLFPLPKRGSSPARVISLSAVTAGHRCLAFSSSRQVQIQMLGRHFCLEVLRHLSHRGHCLASWLLCLSSPSSWAAPPTQSLMPQTCVAS